MRALLLLLVLSVFSVAGLAQPKILFVGDEDLGFGNKDVVRASLYRLSFQYTYFNANDSLRSPSATELSGFDLVIWYTSYDGFKTWFWNGNFEVNPAIQSYLNGGGRLWVSGTDLLYDKYGAPVYTFAPGDFVYDYLGVSSYDVQSYGSDGGTGVSELDLAPGSPLVSADKLTWIYPTAWWIDGVTPTGTGESVYQFGPESYSLAGYSAAVYNETASFKVFSCFFDLYEIASGTLRDQVFKDVIAKLTESSPVFNYVLYGDLNDNEAVNALDASLVLQEAAGLTDAFEGEDLIAADVSGNGESGAYDASLILQKSAGLLDYFPVDANQDGKGPEDLKGKIRSFTVETGIRKENRTFSLFLKTDLPVAGLDLVLTGPEQALRQLKVTLPAGFNSEQALHSGSGNAVLKISSASGIPKTLSDLITFHTGSLSGAISGTISVNESEKQAFTLETDGDTPAKPAVFALGKNHPNPFNPETRIPFSLEKEQVASLVIYNILGQKVRVLLDGPAAAGVTELTWDGKDDAGNPVSSGIYLSRLSSGGKSLVARMILSK
ncbi:MAG: dockerin type I domain-containing protein [Bacteroidetes bacterium]|nr:dockerin type I domain-containing protein [Bacteroidota bacterium]